MKTEQQLSYCPNCGSHMEQSEHNLLVCSSCQFHYYINPKVCNAVILENEKGEILFVKRARDPQKGYWDLPGGFVDLEETIEASVQRELMEELHIAVNEFHYIGSMYDTYPFQGMEMKTVCVLFLGKIDSQTPIKVDDDASDYRFIAKKEIPFEKIAFEGMREALKKYVAKTG